MASLQSISTQIVGLMACTAVRGVIGRQGKIPWSIPKEIAHFQRTTVGGIVIMGRRTFEEMSELAFMDERVGVVVSTHLAAAVGRNEGATRHLHFLRRSAAGLQQSRSLPHIKAGDAVVATCVQDLVERVLPAVVKRATVQTQAVFLIGGNDLASGMLEAGLVDEFILSLIDKVHLLCIFKRDGDLSSLVDRFLARVRLQSLGSLISQKLYTCTRIPPFWTEA
jgi:dihydrofolate reductase